VNIKKHGGGNRIRTLVVQVKTHETLA